MSYSDYFSLPVHQKERESLPLIRALIERYTEERPFEGIRVVFGHLVVRNSMAVVEALHQGGAEVILANTFASPATHKVVAHLAELGIAVLPVEEAVRKADVFFDVSAVLGRLRTPKAAAEATRTGVLFYEQIPCPVVSADNSRAKRIEGFFGTGDGFVRAWKQLRPGDPLQGKRMLQFGYGKIGRGAAHRIRQAGAEVTVADIDPAGRERAEADGFNNIDAAPHAGLEKALANAEVVLSVTSVPGIHSRTLPPEWFRANNPVLANLGAEDEFGHKFKDEEILGGKAVPLNFHLDQPTLNRYVDVPLAAHLLALEAIVTHPEQYPNGVHPLPVEMDEWLLKTWRRRWPDEDLTGIGEELGLQ
jgi:adenosylhomocysteinase